MENVNVEGVPLDEDDFVFTDEATIGSRREEVSSPLPDFDARNFVMDMEWRRSVGVSERPVVPVTETPRRRPTPIRRHERCSRRSCLRCHSRRARSRVHQQTLSPEYVQNLLDIALGISRVWKVIEEYTRV